MRTSQLLYFLTLKELCEERAGSCSHHFATRLQKMKANMLKIIEFRWKLDGLLHCETKFGTAYL